MAYVTPAAADLSNFLGADCDPIRAELLIGMAEKLCKSVVRILPDGAEAVVLAVAARAFANPQNASMQVTGPYSTAFAGAAGGLWLTNRDESTLRRLAGSGGAFSIDPTPTTAGPGSYWAQYPENTADAAFPPFYGDWDRP